MNPSTYTVDLKLAMDTTVFNEGVYPSFSLRCAAPRPPATAGSEGPTRSVPSPLAAPAPLTVGAPPCGSTPLTKSPSRLVWRFPQRSQAARSLLTWVSPPTPRSPRRGAAWPGLPAFQMEGSWWPVLTSSPEQGSLCARRMCVFLGCVCRLLMTLGRVSGVGRSDAQETRCVAFAGPEFACLCHR